MAMAEARLRILTAAEKAAWGIMFDAPVDPDSLVMKRLRLYGRLYRSEIEERLRGELEPGQAAFSEGYIYWLDPKADERNCITSLMSADQLGVLLDNPEITQHEGQVDVVLQDGTRVFVDRTRVGETGEVQVWLPKRQDEAEELSGAIEVGNQERISELAVVFRLGRAHIGGFGERLSVEFVEE